MAKLYYKPPVQQLLVVKPNESSEYEIYVVTPTKIGEAEKIGHQRVVTDDGHTFTNIQGAAKYLAEREGFGDLVEDLGPYMRKRKQTKSVRGMDIVAAQKWVEFCKARGLDVKSAKLVNRMYQLTEDEINQLGLQL